MNKHKLVFTLFGLAGKLEAAANMYMAEEIDLADSEIEQVVLMLSTVMKEQTGINIEDYFEVK